MDSSHSVGVIRDDRDLRRTRGLSAQLRSALGSYRVRIRDMSALGARVEADRLPVAGTIVCLQCGVATLFGAVAWAEGGQGGILFDEELDVQLFGGADGEMEKMRSTERGASVAAAIAKRRCHH